MEPLSDIPTIAMLAYRYGTIKKNELELVNKLYYERSNKSTFNDILINQGFATEHQIGLLQIIQDFYVIQQQGIEFGKIAVEQGFATEEDIEKALAAQKKAFKTVKVKKLIGDILVESKVITLEQRDQVLEQQKAINERSSLLVKSEEESNLSEYEQEFLKVRNLDKEFAKRVINNNFATIKQIDFAKQEQKKEFKTAKKIVLLGDVLVSQGIISKGQKNLILKEQKRIEQNISKKNKNSPVKKISLAISDDGMEALVIIRKSKKNNKDITLEEIKTKLKHEKIKYGIFSDSLIQCYIDKKYTFFPVARGTFPLEHNTQAINYFFETSNVKRESIKKGNPIAEQKISGIGLVGKDIFSNPIERDKLKNIPASLIRCGSGTRLSKDNLKAFAQKTGMPSLSINNKLYIHPILNILEDADLRYGKIEAFADINISGTLSDAYPVTSGNLKATEIRGAEIEAHGNISVALGITGAKIKCQGNIQAKYIKNSTIEAFGDVVVQHEIIDSTIVISGKLKAQNARAISSVISAKSSIDIGSCGSRVTEPCILSAGRDDHILLETEKIDAEIKKVKAELDELRDQREQCIKKADQIFNKMVQLKLFHDNTEKKKKKIEDKLVDKKTKNEKQKASDQNNKKTQALLKKLKNKLKISINSLKALNSDKKKVELKLKQIEIRVEKIEPKIEKSIVDFERDRTMLLSWTSDKPGKSEIYVANKASETTIFKGVFSEKVLQKDFRKIVVKEGKTAGKNNNFSLKILKAKK